MTQQVLHPMSSLQRQVQSLVDSGKLNPNDQLWKIAFLFNKEWDFWKAELLDFGFSMQDPICDLLVVDVWDDES